MHHRTQCEISVSNGSVVFLTTVVHVYAFIVREQMAIRSISSRSVPFTPLLTARFLPKRSQYTRLNQFTCILMRCENVKRLHYCTWFCGATTFIILQVTCHACRCYDSNDYDHYYNFLLFSQTVYMPMQTILSRVESDMLGKRLLEAIGLKRF